MIPSSIIAKMASLGLSETQATAVAEMLSEVERATAAQERAAIDARRVNEAARSRLYRERGGGEIPGQLRQQVYDRDDFSCVYCGSGDYLQCDHAIPVSKGGETTLENLVTACRVCNARKKDRTRKQFVRGMSVDKSGHPKKVGGSPRNVVKDNGPIAQDFAAFWEIWPNRVGKAEAERSFRNIGKRPDYDLAAILSGVRRYIADKPSDRGWLNPATFLNQRRWNDEPAAPTNGNHGGVIAALGRLEFGDDDIFARPEPLPSSSGKGQGATAYGLLPKG